MRPEVAPLVCLLVAGGVAAPSAQQSSPLDRVRAALERPPSRLDLASRKADFSVHIEERHLLQEVFDTPPWATPPVGWQPPAAGFDLLSLFRSVAKEAAAAKRGRDERLAREDVQQSIADYCAAQPDRRTLLLCPGR